MSIAKVIHHNVPYLTFNPAADHKHILAFTRGDMTEVTDDSGVIHRSFDPVNNLCSTHERTPTSERCETCERLLVERMVARVCIADLLDHGYALSVNDGEDTTLVTSTDQDAILAAMFTTDQDFLLVHKKLQDGAGFHANHYSFVHFVYGNSGWDVMSDWGTSLDEAFKVRTADLIAKLGGGDYSH